MTHDMVIVCAVCRGDMSSNTLKSFSLRGNSISCLRLTKVVGALVVWGCTIVAWKKVSTLWDLPPGGGIVLFLQLKWYWDSAKTIHAGMGDLWGNGAECEWIVETNMVSNARSMTPGDIFLQSPAVNRQTILHTRIHTSNLNEYRTSKFKRN